MALVPYSITALAESDADGTSGKNIVAGAVVQFYNAASGGTAQTLYDNAASANPSTSKTTDSQGQVTIYIEQGAYWITINGGTRRAVTITDPSTVVAALVGQSISVAEVESIGDVTINNAAGTSRGLQIESSGSRRWRLEASNEPETGSDAGSNLLFNRYSDANAFLGAALKIKRDDGSIEIFGFTDVTGNSIINSKTAVVTTFKVSETTSIDSMLGVGSTNGNRPFVAALDGVTSAASLDFYINNTLRARIDDGSGALLPGADNAQALGNGSSRWSEVFAANATINTSDESLKTQIEPITDVEKEALLACAGLIGKYQMLDSVERKGADNARWHFGLGAQSAIKEFTDRGLDWAKYSFLCRDDIPVYETQTVTEKQQKTETLTREVEKIEIVNGVPTLIKSIEEYKSPVVDHVGVVDKNGKPVLNKEGEQLTYPVPVMIDVDIKTQVQVGTENRYGVRYEHLTAAILAALTTGE